MPSSRPEAPGRGPLGTAALVPDLLGTLSYTVRELPHLVQDLRELVHQLTRAAQPDGELMRLLDALSELAYARAEREREEAEPPAPRLVATT